ncbi:hypothetical protein EDD37DRAFT_664502 [Exophiala viscosa]|uniref:uncharacterized protein n=1 Tax=Exophiala viscosa TaxID=2486360 RepID=UPI00218E0906|nr:hypothetical protein EDD37DRAFT_664502 [Exophiala viscosa]
MPFYRFIDSDVESESDIDLQPQQTQRQSKIQTPQAQTLQEPVIIDLASDESDAEGRGAHIVHDVWPGQWLKNTKKRVRAIGMAMRTVLVVNGAWHTSKEVEEQDNHSKHDDSRNGRAAKAGDGLLSTDDGQDADSRQETDLLDSFMTNVLRNHRIEPIKDRISKGQQSPSDANYKASKGPRPLKVTSKEIDEILARPKKREASIVSNHALHTNRNIPNGDLVKSDVSNVSSDIHYDTGSLDLTESTDTNAFRLPAMPDGKVCVYRGGRGGGAIGAKSLYKAAAQTSRPSVLRSSSALSGPEQSHGTTTSGVASAKPELREIRPARPRSPAAVSNAWVTSQGSALISQKPMPSSPSGAAISPEPIPTVRMEKRYPNTDRRRVLCETCDKCHQACDGLLPCKTCKASGKGGRCHYDEKRYMRSTAPIDAQPVEPNSGRTITDRAHTRLSPSPSVPVSIPNVQRQSAPVRQEEIPESDTEGQGDGDIPFRDEDDIGDDIIAVVPTVKHAATRYAEDYQETKNSTTRKRRHSEISDNDDDPYPPHDARQFNQRGTRTKRSADDEPWKANGWVYAGPETTNRPTTRLSTSTLERRSYTDQPTRGNTDAPSNQKHKHFRTIKPEHVPDAVKKALANVREDVVLDIAPNDLAHNMSPPRTKSAGRMNKLETILVQREQADATALRGALEALRQDPEYMWDGTSEQERANIVTHRRKVLMDRREKEGVSAVHYMSQLLDLATSSVGPDAILGYLMQSRRNKLKVIGLLDGLVKYDVEDGKLKVPATRTNGEG